MTTKLTTKLLNQKTAPKVFGQGQAYDFFKKGRVHYTSVGSMDPTNPNAQALINVAASKGATLFMAGAECAYALEAEKMIKSSNQELMAGKILSHGEMIDYSTWGEKMVKKAEQQIENNNRAMQIHKESLLTR